MQRIGPATVLSVLLHVGLFLLAYLSWKTAPKPPIVASVPVELVASAPTHEQAEAPVDKLAVKTPEPEPAPEEPVKPTPPTPAPKLPVPTPVKPAVKPEPKPTPAPPDKNGMKKPEPPKKTKPTLDLDALSQIAAAPSKSKTRAPAQANTRKTDGASNFGSAPADAGSKSDLTPVKEKIWPKWTPNCDVPGGNAVVPIIRFTISPNGRVIQGPEWINPHNDPVWEAAAARAMQAVKAAELYTDLPPNLYNRPITFNFDPKSVCNR